MYPNDRGTNHCLITVNSCVLSDSFFISTFRIWSHTHRVHMERVMHQRNWRHLTAAPRSIHAMPLMKGTTEWTNKLINPPTNENNTHMKSYNSPCSDMFTRGVVVMETITLRTRTTMTTAAIDVSRLEIRGPSLTHSSHWHGVWLSQVVTSCLWRLLCARTHTNTSEEMEAVVVIVIVTPILLLLPFINFFPACHLPTITVRLTNDHGFPDICV